MGKFKEFLKKYVLPDSLFEWIFFSSMIIATVVVIAFLLNMYHQTQ